VFECCSRTGIVVPVESNKLTLKAREWDDLNYTALSHVTGILGKHHVLIALTNIFQMFKL